MTESSGAAAREAKRLMRSYPRAWRARYGEEFRQLLLDDISERPRSLTRTVDVLRSGLLTRLAFAGLAGDALEPERQVRAGLKVLAFSVAAFLAAGIAIWSQLAIGWQWSAPTEPATKAGMLVMTGAMVGFLLVAVLAVMPLLWALCRECVCGRGRNLMPPLIALGAGTFVLVIGSTHLVTDGQGQTVIHGRGGTSSPVRLPGSVGQRRFGSRRTGRTRARSRRSRPPSSLG